MDSDSGPPELTLFSLPPEILLHVLTFLDIPDLYTLTKTSHPLRALATSPPLHHRRLRLTSLHLSHILPRRPTSPPPPVITPTELIRRHMYHISNKAKLNLKLSERPPMEALVERGVLLEGASGLVGGVGATAVEEERAKDAARRWVTGRVEGD